MNKRTCESCDQAIAPGDRAIAALIPDDAAATDWVEVVRCVECDERSEAA